MKKNTIFWIAALFGLLHVSCNNQLKNAAKVSDYNFNEPTVKVVLPEILNEISGLVFLDSNLFACVQDEQGVVFIYDLNQKQIIKKIPFYTNGDYEGITKVNQTLFVLRSDGVLIEIENFEADTPLVTEHLTNIKALNNEGLCYDFVNHRLLIAAKGKTFKGHENKDIREIFQFNLTTKTMLDSPAYSFYLPDIKAFALSNKIPVTMKENKKNNTSQPHIKFMTSEVGIHPVTKKMYVLSAKDFLLFVFNLSGNLETIEPLNPKIFNKAEGITFLPNGDAVITNEAQDKKPTLLQFKFR